jgi:3'-phosphoadenosine 5'-phosphosulfate sulfotransferase (PAPS reductase)/FAD synthetase
MTDQRNHIVALSGGKDSTAMALGLMEFEPRDYTFVCTPTGDEFDEMVAHWRNLEAMLGKNIVSVSGRTLDQEIEIQQTIPNTKRRWCTRILKIDPFKAFMEARQPAISYVGLRADELGREGANYGGDVNVLTNGEEVPGVEHRYPLVEWGWELADVWAYLFRLGVEIPERTDCAGCFYQRIGEWFLLWRDYPERFQHYEAQELAYGYTRRMPQWDRETGEPIMIEKYGHRFQACWRDSWPAWLSDMRICFENGHQPTRSLRGLEQGSGCRVCTM